MSYSHQSKRQNSSQDSRRDTVSLASTEDDFDNWTGSEADDDDDSLYKDFDKFESKHEEIESSANAAALTGRRIYALNPYEIAKVIEHDSKMEKEFFSNINSLHSLLYICDKAITVFHNVNSKALGRTDAYDGAATGLAIIPIRSNSSKIDDSKSPNSASTKNDREVVEKFLHFKRVRFVVSYFVMHIRQLGESILAAVEKLESSKGNDGFNVKETIRSVLKFNLHECNEQVKKLDGTLKVILQRDYLKQIQNDLGWSALDEFTLDTLDEIDSLEKKQREKHVEMKCQLDKLSNYSNLMSATQKQLPHSHSNVEAKESRIKTLGKTIAETKQTVTEVAASASSSEYLQWLHWWTTKGDFEKFMNLYKNLQNETLKGTEEIAYYDSLAYVRKKGIARSAAADDKKLNEKINRDLKEQYNVFNSKYKKAKVELGDMTNQFKSIMGKHQFKIGGLIKKLSKMPELDWMLISSFACIYTFVKSIENRNGNEGTAFHSLFAILSEIETLISTDVELLSSDERLDVFVAGKRLKKDAAFILNFAEDLMYL
ncbi:hypothetical protein HA402_002685 [Bradysia odoriphaga]|nr:hypothetical protein HA402_002685 [Bradysia odoriphaga]